MPLATQLLELARAVLPTATDFSDPFHSYLSQMTARVAGVIGDAFAPYVPVFLPILLGRIYAPVGVKMVDGDAAVAGAEGNDVVSVYKRGLGHLNVVYSAHEVQEKETACQCLYQYCRDIPHLVWTEAEALVDAVAALLSSPLACSADDVYMVISCLLPEIAAMFLRHVEVAADVDAAAGARTANAILEKSLRALLGALKALDGRADRDWATRRDLLEGIRDVIKVRWRFRRSPHRCGAWPVDVPPALLEETVEYLRDSLALTMSRHFADGDGDGDGDEEEDVDAREQCWALAIDVVSTLLRVFGDQVRCLFSI